MCPSSAYAPSGSFIGNHSFQRLCFNEGRSAFPGFDQVHRSPGGDSAYWMVYEADGKGAKLFKTLCRYNNKAFLEGLRFRLFKLFPEKSKYER